MIKMLQLLCCKFVMIKIADKPWQIIGLGPATLLRKKTLAQVFSCEFCEIYKNTSGDCFWCSYKLRNTGAFF